MTSELWERLKPLFHAALEEDTENRAAFIDSVCDGNLELKRHLEQLLEAEQQDTGSLDAPLARLNGFLNDRGTRFQSGELVLGRFRIIRPIGKGGMGEVYEAEDLQLGTVALKTIRGGIASSSDAFERFRQEVQLARRVSGPQVCRIHELYLLPASGRFEATAFLTMEYLDGITLYEKVHRDGPLPWKEALNITLEICEGLRLIHEKGIIHRDLKTGNIMLCKQAGTMRVVLMDFGLARDFGADASEKTRSSPGPGKTLPQMIMGTPEYMAPEQFEAQPVSPATDIYALGIILYELVTGLHPYAADTPVAAAIRRAKHPVLPSSFRPRIPGQCDRIIERCLQYDPEKRFQSAKEVAKALRAGPANIENLKRDRPWVLWFASAMVLGLIAGSAFFFWQSRQYYRPTPEALRWYNAGLAALREGNNVKATRSLQQAISQDNHFVMAHARLAEAWSNLDFDGNAQREFLLATPGGRHLQPLDRMYLDAIHATVTKDSPTEIATYRQILNRLPPVQRSSGHVDLGMAYESAGDLPHALENYSEASRLDVDNSAAFLHTAVLQSRLHHLALAEKAFQRVETLFTTDMNEEGLAELDYDRGYSANENGKIAEANQYLNRSIEAARKIPSVQLEIRDLSQLSSVAIPSNADQATKYAEESIRLARENQLDAWAANGLVRLAAAKIRQGKLDDAEDSLDEAMKIAHQTQQPRTEALANLNMASLMNQRQLPDKVIGPAQSALDYYQKHGFFVPAANASTLLIRAQRDKGQYQQALDGGNAFISLASKTEIPGLMMQAEELIGTILLQMERYPDALTHFEKAKSLAATPADKTYQSVHLADVLWRLGHYKDSDDALEVIPANQFQAAKIGEIHTLSLMSRGSYEQALAVIQELTNQYPKVVASNQQVFALDRAIAESHLGMKKQTMADLDDIRRRSKASDAGDDAANAIGIAEASLNVGLTQEARDAASKATAHYASTGQLDSELRSVCIAATASKELNNSIEFSSYSQKAVDILAQIKHTWSPQEFETYLSRPDIRTLIGRSSVADLPDRRSHGY